MWRGGGVQRDAAPSAALVVLLLFKGGGNVGELVQSSSFLVELQRWTHQHVGLRCAVQGYHKSAGWSAAGG